MTQGIERRKYPRVYFTVKDNIQAFFKLPGSEKPYISTNILSISEGGISFMGKRKEMQDLSIEDEVVLIRLLKPKKLQSLQNLRLQVRYIVNDSKMKNILVGCAFVDDTKEQKMACAEFVDQRLNRSNE